MKKILLLLSLNCYIFGTQITLEFLQDKPKGIARDFYIWRFLQNPQTPLNEATQAYELIYRKTPQLEKLMAQKGYVTELPKEVKCKRLPFSQLKSQDAECIAYGIQLSIIPSLSAKDTSSLIKILQPQYPKLAKEIQILSSKHILNSLKQEQDASVFSEIFFALKLEQRLEFFNQAFPPSLIETLGNQNNPNFNKFLQYVLLSDHFDTLKSSILQANITSSDDKTLLLLGIIEVKNNHIKQALQYFTLSQNRAKLQASKDKALFWQYLLTQNQQLLEQLSQSTDVNLYSIYATQKLKKQPQYSIVSKIDVPLKQNQPQFDITSPFEWQNLRDEIFKASPNPELEASIESKFAFLQTEPHLAFALNRFNRYKDHYFIMPYAQDLNWQNNHQKALTYAIARQESNFLPALISTSYALGMMQIMPFNVEPFAKALQKPDITLDDLFKPKIALELGRYYLAELEAEFKHPLFVAYAYNGGPGFLRRTLQKKKYFSKSRPYDPWLSLELIPYEESRKYGQIVLANYIIYQQILGKEIDIDSFLKETLIYS